MDDSRLTIRISGYNIPSEAIPAGETPESITAAYARISRSPKNISELRDEARAHVDKARRSNERIVYDMGHASIAEHACLNIDIEGISRLALEILERHRLASYTERSQRYVKLDIEPWIPEEVRQAGEEQTFVSLQKEAVSLYSEMVDAGIPREDARYVLPMAVPGQVGMTVNARTLEHMILHLLATPLKEAQTLGHKLLEGTGDLIPSLIRYVEPSEYHIREASMGLTGPIHQQYDELSENVTWQGNGVGRLSPLVIPPSIEMTAAAAYLAHTHSVCFSRAQSMLEAMEHDRIVDLISQMYKGASIHDSLPRALEHVNITWEMVLSSAAFAQLKRHRIAGITWGRYLPHLGFTVPPSIAQSSFAPRLHETVLKAEALFGRLSSSPASSYVLMGGHRRQVIWTANVREHFHFSRLREDEHAQWDIRAFATAMGDLLRNRMPVFGRFLGGKSELTDSNS